MYSQSNNHQSYSQQENYSYQEGSSSSKKKLTTPALLFCKNQKGSSSKQMSQNNSSLLNTSKSPTRLSNAKDGSRIDRTPLISKQNSCFQNKAQNSIVFSKQVRNEHIFNLSRHNLDLSSVKQSVHLCENHQNRTASYFSSMDRSNIEYYCQKCAILMASQGYSVQKISESFVLSQSRQIKASRTTLRNSQFEKKSSKSSQSNHMSNSRSRQYLNSRRSQINNFLSMSKQLLEQIEGKKDQIKQNIIRSQEFYGQQIQEVNQYFQLVQKSLQLQKNKCYNYILNQRVEVQKPARMILETISELREKIQGIIEDIQENIETVFQTTDQIYKPVIQQYQDNYEDIQAGISQIQISQVQMRKIDFQGVPQSVFYLSDLLKDSIEHNNQFQNQMKMNQQLNSLRESLKQSMPRIQPRKLFTKRNQELQDIYAKQNSKLCFSFEGQALQSQLQQQKIIFQNDQ